MATTYTETTNISTTPPLRMVSWTLQTGENGQTYEGGYLADKSIQIFGTALTTFVLQGSNNGTDWATLSNPGGVAINATGGARIEQILQNTRYIRPSVTTGTDITFILMGRVGLI